MKVDIIKEMVQLLEAQDMKPARGRGNQEIHVHKMALYGIL